MSQELHNSLGRFSSCFSATLNATFFVEAENHVESEFTVSNEQNPGTQKGETSNMGLKAASQLKPFVMLLRGLGLEEPAGRRCQSACQHVAK